MSTAATALINVIGYARVSTNAQANSLINQIRDIKLYDARTAINARLVLMQDITGASMGMTFALKSAIIKLYNTHHKQVIIYVSSIDRLTRNPADAAFLRRHVKHIHLIRDIAPDTDVDNSIIINPRADRVNLCKKLDEAHAEIAVLRERAIRTRAANIACFAETIPITKDEKIRRAANRLHTIQDVVDSIDELFDHVFTVKFIQQTQALRNLADWETADQMAQCLGVRILDDYTPNPNVEHHLTRADLTGYLGQMYPTLCGSILKEYLNAVLHLDHMKSLEVPEPVAEPVAEPAVLRPRPVMRVNTDTTASPERVAAPVGGGAVPLPSGVTFRKKLMKC